MCGIVGYIGKNTEKILLDKLKMLEYRGYDSAGIAVSSAAKTRIFKAKGEIANLEKKVKPLKNGKRGIAHTRWATHGVPDEINAHPHFSSDGQWFVVHNGIIENYAELKQTLVSLGFKFYSDTDTEVIAKLFDFYGGANDFTTLQNVLNNIKGSYALAIMKREGEGLFFAKNKNPLYVAKNGQNVMIASDIICFCGFSEQYYELKDGEYGYADKDSVLFGNRYGIINKKSRKINFAEYCSNKSVEHYMLKEIYETKEAIKNIAEHYSDDSNLTAVKTINFNKIHKIHIVGCGTAYNAGLIGGEMIERETAKECRAFVASEYRYNPPTIDNGTLTIFVSQSGETADTISACELAKSKGTITLAIVNVEHSALAKLTDFVLPIKAGHEIAVASTKAYSAQLAVFYILSKIVKGVADFSDIAQALSELYSALDFECEKVSKQISDILKTQKELFMIGRGSDYYTALEAGLKIKETCYINCDAYFAGELKHGFLALIENDFIVVVFATDERLLSKTLCNAEETLARGAKVILFTCFDLEDTVTDKFFKVIKIKKIQSPLQKVVNIVPWQLIAYYTSLNKGINPDKPRNLAKSVTVE